MTTITIRSDTLLSGRLRQTLAHQVHSSINRSLTRTLPSLARSYGVKCNCDKVSNTKSALPDLPISRAAASLPSGNQPTSHYSTELQRVSDPVVHDVFEAKTGSWQYIVADPETSAAVIIDPVLDYDPMTQSIKTETADKLLAIIKENKYKVDRILETHAHADHVTAASYLQRQIEEQKGQRPPVCIGARINQVQQLFSARYGVPSEEYKAVFDKVFEDDEEFSIGNIAASAIHIPGHTPDHMGYKIGANVFSGDLIFYKDLGTARADFPGGSASQLFKSAQKILSLPGHVRIWAGHDYPTGAREAIPSMTVQEHREQNKHLMNSLSEEEFVRLREARDAALAAPKLLHPSLQMNIRGGKLPSPNDSGLRLLHLPLKLGTLSW